MNLKKPLLHFFLGILFVFPFLIPLSAVHAETAEDFQVAAKAAISVEAETGKILYSQNSDEKLGIASITKIISLYLVQKEIAEGRLQWEDEVSISEELAELSVHPELSNVPLDATLTYTVKELFDSAAIQSANASVMALAVKIAGSEQAFVDMMKQQLTDWGLSDFTLVNSSGLNNSDLGDLIYPGSKTTDENMLSAKDVAIIARHLIHDYPDYLEVSSTSTKMFGEDTYSPVEMQNWNWLLPDGAYGKEGVDGLKTGTTDLAGASFVGTMSQDGQRIITVVLNATDGETDPGARFTETSRLMDYSYENWHLEEIIEAGETIPEVKEVAVYQGKDLTVPVVASENLQLWLPKNLTKADVTFEASLDSELLTEEGIQAPIAQGTEVGIARAIVSDDSLGYLEESDMSYTQSSIQTTQEVQKANIFVLMFRTVKSWFN